MTSFASPVQHPFPDAPAAPTAPSLPRLLGGGLVATMGIVVFSIAIGNQVVGSSHALVASQAEAARHLVTATPILVAIGLLHVITAVALARGRDGLRIVAVLVTGLASLAAASSAAMFAAGVDPFSWSGGGQPPTSGVALLVIAAIAYGSAAVAAGSGPAES
ncbi:MAG TPA: hypothetical protein VFY18_04735 [Candidatus Limnocylindrales bacterium]|nr:hypothetical protein [Candidatus Limnocylindrales bacterium]